MNRQSFDVLLTAADQQHKCVGLGVTPRVNHNDYFKSLVFKAHNHHVANRIIVIDE